jgi:hypothetical protein
VQLLLPAFALEFLEHCSCRLGWLGAFAAALVVLLTLPPPMLLTLLSVGLHMGCLAELPTPSEFG